MLIFSKDMFNFMSVQKPSYIIPIHTCLETTMTPINTMKQRDFVYRTHNIYIK